MIRLPFPPASLSGHAKGHWRGKSGITASLRAQAFNATVDAGPFDLPEKGDIRIVFQFVPPDNRGDRVNYPNRLKPLIDGIADALGVNDKRFHPSYLFWPAEKPGHVLVTLGEASAQ